MSHKRPWKRGQEEGTPLAEEEKPLVTPDAREDEQDAKDAEEARQEPGERVSLESYIATRERDDPTKCHSVLCLEEEEYVCGQPVGHRGAHGARGQAVSFSGATCNFKLLWDETMEIAR